VTDVYDALGNDRVYKKKWELEQIIELFEEERGKQFDPKLTDLFLSNIKEFEKMKESLV
jgi:response regulator RpfG family c-di-GMP phosphodiesterase